MSSKAKIREEAKKLNPIVKDGSEVSELMSVFTDGSAYNKKFPVTSAEKHHYKQTERGVEVMCDIVQKLVDEERAEGMAEGEAKGVTRGKAETQNRMVQLIGILTDNNDIVTLKNISKDPALLEELYKKYNI